MSTQNQKIAFFCFRTMFPTTCRRHMPSLRLNRAGSEYSALTPGAPASCTQVAASMGLPAGALSLMDNPFRTAEFGPLLPQTQSVPFGDLVQLEKHLVVEKIC